MSDTTNNSNDVNVKTVYLDKYEMNKYIDTLTKTIINDTSSLGEYVFKSYLVGNIDSEIINEKCEEIDKKFKLIKQIKDDLAKLEEEKKQMLGQNMPINIYTCSACNSSFSKPFKFCVKCGSRYIH